MQVSLYKAINGITKSSNVPMIKYKKYIIYAPLMIFLDIIINKVFSFILSSTGGMGGFSV